MDANMDAEKCDRNFALIVEKLRLRLPEMNWAYKKKRRWKARYLNVGPGEDAWYKRFIAIHPRVPVQITIGLIYSSRSEDDFDPQRNKHCYFMELKGAADQKVLYEWYAYDHSDPEHDPLRNMFLELCDRQQETFLMQASLEQQEIASLVDIL